MSDLATRPYLERVLRADLLDGAAYHVPPAEGLVKLDAMENPYPLPEALREAWQRGLAETEVNRYPDPAASRLKTLLAAYIDLPDGAQLLLGNGSDELIQLLATAAHAAGGRLMAPEPSFSMYRVIAASLGMPYTGVPLVAGDFSLDTDAMLEALRRERPSLLFLATPNNPTGNRFEEPAVERLVEAAPGLVVIDEAYAPFAAGHLLRLCVERPNVVVLRTLSKMGLAGLRLGALAGAPAWIREFDKLRLPYNVNALSQAAACIALSCPDAFAEQVARITAERDRLRARLAALPGATCWASETNFLLLHIAARGGEAAAGLRARGVLVKNLHGTHPLLEHCLRITVGRPEENAALLEALADFLASG